MLLSAIDKSLTVPESLTLSLIGFLVVFVALISLIAVIKVLAVLSGRRGDAARTAPDQPGSSPPPPVSDGMVPAAYSLGEIDLYNVDERSAALIMAIVADRLEAPINTLQFKSIKQIDEV